MLEKFFRRKAPLALLAGISVFLAFPKFDFLWTVFLFPVFFNALIYECDNWKTAFRYGFLTSLIIMIGGFYWVVYVIHEFGYMPWAASVFLYLGFCGFGALNFPLTAALAFFVQRRLFKPSQSKLSVELWVALGLPALFTVVEFCIPKLFPWYIGHSFYQSRWANQIVDITGAEFLTFVIYSLGSVLGFYLLKPAFLAPLRKWVPVVPLGLFAVCIIYSSWRLNQPSPPSTTLKVALIQPNIGSLERMAARRGVWDRLNHVVQTYRDLTDQAMREKPDLVLWPEAGIPINLLSHSYFSELVRREVRKWKTTFVLGSFATDPLRPDDDYNAAFLFEPGPAETLNEKMYYKNILLAFGEYFPGGELFPKLYRIFPQVSNFARGKQQEPFVLASGLTLGITICYEAIVPAFVRKVALHRVQGLVNLTNDSWFGPTAEPYLHGALTVFRALEYRIPFMRVTNTGTSFFVSTTGEISKLTPTYERAILVNSVSFPVESPETFYLKYGDWFIVLCVSGLTLGLVILSYRNASIPL